MIGLPWFLTFWVYSSLWPADLCYFDERWHHHFATAIIMVILLIVGPTQVVKRDFTLNSVIQIRGERGDKMKRD